MMTWFKYLLFTLCLLDRINFIIEAMLLLRLLRFDSCYFARKTATKSPFKWLCYVESNSPIVHRNNMLWWLNDETPSWNVEIWPPDERKKVSSLVISIIQTNTTTPSTMSLHQNDDRPWQAHWRERYQRNCCRRIQMIALNVIRQLTVFTSIHRVFGVRSDLLWHHAYFSSNFGFSISLLVRGYITQIGWICCHLIPIKCCAQVQIKKKSDAMSWIKMLSEWKKCSQICRHLLALN